MVDRTRLRKIDNELSRLEAQNSNFQERTEIQFSPISMKPSAFCIPPNHGNPVAQPVPTSAKRGFY
ncbi:unnamed protein product, partial [Sphenostylis stenocarpa]